MQQGQCDLCGETDSLDTPGDPSGKIRICSGCGFVHVKERRSVEEVANAWEQIYADKIYDPDWPGVRARLFYVAEWLADNVGLDGRSVLDIGAGNGLFLSYVRDRGGYPVGLDPSTANATKVSSRGISCLEGWASNEAQDIGQFDIATLNWTLENTADCLEVLRYAKRQLKPDGHVVVATGSRILVPFKKPFSSYIPQDPDYPHDTHCFRFSALNLERTLLTSGLISVNCNDYKQRDEFIAVARAGRVSDIGLAFDDAEEVQDYFRRWQKEFP